MESLLLENITVNGKQCDIRIDGSVIGRITPHSESSGPHSPAADLKVFDCSGKTAVPGFINMHTHAGMSIIRGVGEDMVFQDWIRKIWEIEKQVDPEFVYWSTKVSCIEMIRTGTTTFNDMYWHEKAARQAAREMGLRTAVGYHAIDYGNPELTPEKIKEGLANWEDEKDNIEGSIYLPAMHAVYSVSPGLIRWISDFAREHGYRLHLHLSETRKEVEECRMAHSGMSPVEYLDSLGVLGEDVIAAHCLNLSEKDVRILGERKVNCVHCINSNAKLCSGYRFLYNELRDAGANVCLGTDSAVSSNNLDMLEAMKTAALFQKAWREDPTALPLDELLRIATENGARALGINAGVIREGASADLLVVDTGSTFFLSPAPFLGNFIYSAHSDCIESVIASGKFVMRNREIPGEKEILEEARKVLGKLKQ